MKPLSDLISGRGFDGYQDGLRSRFRAYRFGYRVTYLDSESDPGLRLDFETALHRGMALVRESGACDLQAWDAASGETVFEEHHELQTEMEFYETYPRLVLFMRDATGWAGLRDTLQTTRGLRRPPDG